MTVRMRSCRRKQSTQDALQSDVQSPRQTQVARATFQVFPKLRKKEKR